MLFFRCRQRPGQNEPNFCLRKLKLHQSIDLSELRRSLHFQPLRRKIPWGQSWPAAGEKIFKNPLFAFFMVVCPFFEKRQTGFGLLRCLRNASPTIWTGACARHGFHKRVWRRVCNGTDPEVMGKRLPPVEIAGRPKELSGGPVRLKESSVRLNKSSTKISDLTAISEK